MHFPLSSPGAIALGPSPLGPAWLRLETAAAAVGEARRFTAAQLTECDPGFIEDAELVTSELITNAVNYALAHDGPSRLVVPGIWLGVQLGHRFSHVRVRDPYPVLPVRRAAADTDTGGRGLLIVEMLTAAYWVDSRTFDKTVHAVVAKPGIVLTEAELDGMRS